MISAYNAVSSFINSQSSFNATTQSAGLLSGDATLRNIQSTLQSTITNSWSMEGSIRSLGQLGISFERDGSLQLDESRLREALARDAEGVASFFMGANSGGGGMLTNMGEALSGLANSNTGPIKTAMDGLNNNIRGVQQNIASFELRLEARESLLYAQFSAADQALRLMNLTMGSINNSLSALNNMMNSNR
jgi:flagellar hook-associated protein 2